MTTLHPPRSRYTLRAAALTLALVGSALTAQASGVSDDVRLDHWRQRDHDAGGSAYNPGESTLNIGNVGQLTVLWRANSDGATVTPKVVYTGSGAENSDCRRAPQTGAPSRCVDVPGITAQAPALNSVSQVYTSTFADYSGQLSVYDRKSTLTWSVTSGAPFGQPALQGGAVYARYNSGYTAFDLESGAIRWTIATDSTSPPVVASDRLFILDGSHYQLLRVFDTTTGAFAWRTDILPSDLYYRPRAAGNRVVFNGYSTGLWVYGIQSGKLLWRYSNNGTYREIAIVTRDTMIGKTVNYLTGENSITAYNAANGTVRWNAVLPSGAGSWTNMALANGVVYFLQEDSTGTHLATLDANTGALGPINPEPIVNSWIPTISVAQGHVYVGGRSGAGDGVQEVIAFGLPASAARK